MERIHEPQRKVGSIIASFLWVASVGMLFPACGNSTGSTEGAGGAPGSGGEQSTGGAAPSTGGAQSTGGVAPSTGGLQSTGGVAPSTGGVVPSTGGVIPETGGVKGSGGVAPEAGTPATGGGPSTGGVARTGGVGPKTGGAPGTGGIAPATGGAPGSGGVPATGGATKPPPSGTGHYQMENLDRGVVAVKVTGGVYVGWRMFGTEYTGTDADTTYNLYKDGTKLTSVTDSTNYLDAAGTATSKYSVSVVLKGKEGVQSDAVTPWAQQYLSIPLTVPPAGKNGGTYSANDASPGDLDGDGKLDIVLKWDPSNAHDNAQSGITDDVIIDGYTMAGKRLWSIDLGPNIRAGAHYTQLSVYDFDGDGKAEVALKTAPGTKDGTGAFLSKGPAATDDDTAIYRNTSGTILTGPEYMTVFDGATGKELDTIEYPFLRSAATNWGDTTGNRQDRFNGGFAFVKDAGVATGLPSIISGRGYYTRQTISAMTFRNGVLAKNWVYDSVSAIPNGGGCHSMMAADVDADGAQEIIPGARTINSDGTFRCDSGMGHGDAMDVSELIPGKGITTFSIHESLGGQDSHDASTCKTNFVITNPGQDTGRGRAEYVSAGNDKMASCVSSQGVVFCDGSAGAPNAGSNFVIYWDADEWRELENGTSITKVGGGTLLSCAECASCNGTKSTPTLSADLLGDWREEIVWRESSNANLRIYTTTEVTKRRIYTLMHDPTYRAQVNFEQSAYNQPPHTGWRIAPNMDAPPVPDIFLK